MTKSFLIYFFISTLLLSSLAVLLSPFSTSAWTGNPSKLALPSGIDPIALYNEFDTSDITEADSFFVYKQGGNPDRIYMAVSKTPNKIRVGTFEGQSFMSSTSGTWDRFYINTVGTKSILWADWSNAEYDVTDYYMAYNIAYDSYSGSEFVNYEFPTPEPEPEPEPTGYELRFGQQIGIVLSLMLGGYVIWLLRYRR